MSKQKKIEITPAKLKIIQADAVHRTVVLIFACLMDEFGFREDELTLLANTFEKYSGAVDEHLITINKIKQIINEVAYGTKTN